MLPPYEAGMLLLMYTEFWVEDAQKIIKRTKYTFSIYSLLLHCSGNMLPTSPIPVLY